MVLSVLSVVFERASLILARRLKWNSENEQFVGDEEAGRLLGRVYREPWTLPM